MKSASWLALTVALTSILGACSRAQVSRSFNGNWDESRAREIATTIAQSWRSSLAEDFRGTPTTDLQPKVYAVLPFDAAGVSRWLVLLATIPPGQTCHACAPVTGGVLFARKDGAWQALSDQSHIVQVGGNGEPPRAHTQSLSPAKPAVAFEIGAMAQGLEATTLTLVAEVQGSLREVFSTELEESNEAAGLPQDQTFKWHATLETKPSSSPDFPDILLKCSGTKSSDDGQTIHPYSATLTYRFKDSAYKLVQ